MSTPCSFWCPCWSDALPCTQELCMAQSKGKDTEGKVTGDLPLPDPNLDRYLLSGS